MKPGGSSGPGVELPRPRFAVILCITVTGIMGQVLITPALPDIAEDLGVSTSRVGLLVAAATAPGILLAPVMGMLADRFGRREVIVPCLTLFGLAGGASCFAPGFGALVGLRLLQGVGSAGLVNLAVVLITDHWEGLDRARKIGQNVAALTAAIIVLPPLGGLLTSLGGWRATFVPYWIAPLAGAVVLVGIPPRRRRSEGSIARQVSTARRALRSRAVLGPMVLGLVVFVLIFGLFLTVMPVYLSQAFGLGGAGRGLVMALPALTATGVALSLGRLRARLGPPALVGGGLVLFVAGFGLVGLVPRVGAVCAGALLYGLGDGLIIATLQDAVAAEAPEDSRGAVVATWMSFVRTGQTAGPLLAGAGLGAVGHRTTFVAGATLAALVALSSRFLVRSGAPPVTVLAPVGPGK